MIFVSDVKMTENLIKSNNLVRLDFIESDLQAFCRY